MDSMETEIVLAVMGKISNLLIQESVALLGVEDQIQWIESKLRKEVYRTRHVHDKKRLREVIYDIEDVIDELLIKSTQMRNRGTLMRYVLGFFDWVHQYKLRKKLDQIKGEIIHVYTIYLFFCAGSWCSFDPYKLDIGSTIVSPVVSKFAELATEKQLSLAVRRQARWLRDEFRQMHEFLRSEEISEEGMAWMEELCKVSGSAEDLIGLFFHKREQLKRSWGGPFKILILSFHNFESQHQLRQEMGQIKAKVQDIYGRRYDAIRRRSFESSLPFSRGRRRDSEDGRTTVAVRCDSRGVVKCA